MARGRKFAAFDIDGTLIRWQLYHAVVDNLVKRGVIDGERFETIRGARMAWKKRDPGASFKTYESEIVAAYEEALTKITSEQLMVSVEDVFGEYKDQVYTYTRQLIKNFKARGYLIFAISGSQTEIVRLMAQHYEFDDYLGTEYEQQSGRFTGKSKFHAGDKAKALASLVKKHSADFAGSVGVGDSKSDAAMMKLVEHPVAFNPDGELYAIAEKMGWQIVIERKNMVYELEKKGGQYVLAQANAR